ncbi:MAG: hypothetical protein ABSC46_11080 [Candidatus Limnocylindrales bacterium]
MRPSSGPAVLAARSPARDSDAAIPGRGAAASVLEPGLGPGFAATFMGGVAAVLGSGFGSGFVAGFAVFRSICSL